MVLDAGGYALARLTPIARGAYASVEDAIRPWLNRRRRDPTARHAHCSTLAGSQAGRVLPHRGSAWSAAQKKYYVRGSRRVFRLRRLRSRGAN